MATPLDISHLRPIKNKKPKPGKGIQPVRKLMGPNVFSNALKQQGPQAFWATNDRLVMQALHHIL